MAICIDPGGVFPTQKHAVRVYAGLGRTVSHGMAETDDCSTPTDPYRATDSH